MPKVQTTSVKNADNRGVVGEVVCVLGAVVFVVVCQVPGFVEACLGRFLSCCCVFVFCLLRCDSAQGEVRAACVVPVDPG